MKDGQRERILVLRGGAIGDFILTLPAIAALRLKFPQAELHILGEPRIAGLAVAARLADAVSSVNDPSLAGFFIAQGTSDPEQAKFFSSVTLAVSYLSDPDKVFESNFRRCSSARFIVAPHRPNEAEKMHASGVYLKPLECLGIFNADPVPRLSIGGHSPVRKTVALHPGSGSERKNWPEPQWAELMAFLIERSDGDLLLIGGEAEGDRLQRLRGKFSSARIHLAQHLPLVELALRMKACVAYVGHDSGISHLAAALDLPGLILWGPTVAEIWRPRSDKMTLLRGTHTLAQLNSETVFDELKKILAQRDGRILS
jgi:heptosyltransferase-2